MMPDFFHIIPVCDDSVFNWVFQGKDTSFALCFISNIGIFLSHSNHNTLVTGSTNDGWEDSTWASSPANPALHIPEPLSTTRAATSSSHIVICGVLCGYWWGFSERIPM